MKTKILGMIMAGGKGERLYPLTKDRTKPAVPFGGKYRLIDFALSNFLNSHIYAIYVLTQFKAQSLIEHLQDGWQLGQVMRDHFIVTVPAQMRLGESWYRGTADAIYQNLNLIKRFNPDIVAVFGADHIYRMDIRQMVKFHFQNNADLTVATVPVPIKNASQLGIIDVAKDGRIIGFQEKPKSPHCIPGRPDEALVSMGNYLFSTEVLMSKLKENALTKETEHDFGKNIIPALYEKKRVFAYDFRKNRIPGEESAQQTGYWRDIGTIDSYYQANMDLRAITPSFNLYNPGWPIKTTSYTELPPAKFVFNEHGRQGSALNSIICEGTIISGGEVKDSVVGRNVFVHSYSEINRSIIMDNVDVGRHSRITHTIIDKNVEIPEGAIIGYNLEEDRKKYYVSPEGIVVIPRAEPKD
ncbi:glucose-1-phosphate adenylyltransferase [bacterium]|nr:glucose-1-phosphate adenylyltransferase [bacterium]NIN91426.1 glucose-1-phosphate adenylyltransferase [bacterium]NIO17836.1 glucose-1-phosphate adenylyltransferase [bacterium]NIO72817.1 glucose-1-phosphate adenylyltransferase [bacterium]